MKVNKIAVIGGDGIGPEVIHEAVLLLRHYADERGFLVGLLTLLAEGGCFLVVYLAGLRLSAPATWAELASAVRQARPR